MQSPSCANNNPQQLDALCAWLLLQYAQTPNKEHNNDIEVSTGGLGGTERYAERLGRTLLESSNSNSVVATAAVVTKLTLNLYHGDAATVTEEDIQQRMTYLWQYLRESGSLQVVKITCGSLLYTRPCINALMYNAHFTELIVHGNAVIPVDALANLLQTTTSLRLLDMTMMNDAVVAQAFAKNTSLQDVSLVVYPDAVPTPNGAILRHLAHHSNLQHLTIGGPYLSPANRFVPQLDKLTKLVDEALYDSCLNANPSCLTHLTLAFQSFTAVRVERLVRGLQVASTLQKLTLKNCWFNDEALSVLESAIASRNDDDNVATAPSTATTTTASSKLVELELDDVYHNPNVRLAMALVANNENEMMLTSLWRTFTWKWPSRHSNQTSQSSAQTTLTTTTSNTLRLADFWNAVAGGHYSVSSLCTIRLQQLSYNDLAAVTAALSTSLRSSLQELHIDEWVDIEIATAIAKTPASMTSVTDADSSASLSVASSATTASLMSLSSEGDANSEDQSSSNVASRVDEPVSPKVLSLQLARAIVHDCECLHTFTVAGCFPTFWSSVRQGRMVQAALERNKHERRLLVATLALPLPTSSLSTTSATDQLVANVTTTTSSKPLSSNSASAIIQSLAPTMAVSTAVHATQTGPNSMLKGLLGYSANAR